MAAANVKEGTNVHRWDKYAQHARNLTTSSVSVDLQHRNIRNYLFVSYQAQKNQIQTNRLVGLLLPSKLTLTDDQQQHGDDDQQQHGVDDQQ